MSIVESLQDCVRENLSLLIAVDRAWQPTDYLPDLSAEDWGNQVLSFRESARGLPDDVLVVLVGNLVTEEALPNYSVTLDNVIEHPGVSSDTPWGQWLRGWSAEENRHGDLLNAYLRLTGRVDMRAVERTIHHLIRNGFDTGTKGEPCAGIVYAAFQERATRLTHANVARLSAQHGDENLATICRKIAADEARHETFYSRIVARIIADFPEQGILAYRAMLKGLVAMPGKRMSDSRDPSLFERFSAVTQRLKIYTAADYGGIIAHLNALWGIGSLSLSGVAAKAQDYICRQPDRYQVLAAELDQRALEFPTAPFSWLKAARCPVASVADMAEVQRESVSGSSMSFARPSRKG
jgi:acyl-[acyl-carrier-protein] desaturase